MSFQALKDPIGTKGARLSTQVSIAGRLLVYLPREKHIGISQRIEESEREALRARIQALLPEGEEGGYIARTMAENASDDGAQGCRYRLSAPPLGRDPESSPAPPSRPACCTVT